MSHVLPLQASDAAPRLELDRGWEFYPDRSGRLRYHDLDAVQEWRQARAGLSWNVQFDDLRDYMGAAWYRTRVEIPRFSDTRHVLLKFGAVDYFCELYVNGVSVGTHEGGYTPFTFDITSAVHAGSNELALRVIDPPMDEAENRELFPEMMYNEIPHGKQSWYVQNSGIWQGVRIEFCPAVYVDRVDITPNYGGDFRAAIKLAGIGLNAEDGAVAHATTITVAISDTSGRVVCEYSEPLEGRNHCEIRGTVPRRRDWSPESPHLYVADVALSGAVQYRRRVRFGFRKFEAREGKFFLNDKPFYMMATLDQDFYPETIHTPASEEFVREMMLKAKRLGVNVLRCHLKVAHPVYLDIADEMGMLVWAEMPSWSDSWFPADHFSSRAALRGEQMFSEIMARDWNHPCLVVRTIINESWGINLKQPEQRRWLMETFDRVKETLRPVGRLVIDNSACEGNFHLKTDIEDFHQYYSMPDQVELWNKWLNELASRPEWTFSPYGDAVRTGQEPLVVSEFGNWGLPVLPETEELPWWFHYSFGGREITTPSGVFERFRSYLSPLFRDYNDFAIESQWHQYISLKYEIESIRSKASIQGYVVTAMTDVHWEVNGLLDMWRNPKVYAEQLAKLQQPDLVFAWPEKWSYHPGAEIRARLMLSHYSDVQLQGARLRWTAESGAGGTLEVGNLPSGTVHDLGEIRWTAPQVSGPTLERVWLEIRLRNGTRVAENHLDVFLVPRFDSAEGKLTVHNIEGLAEALTVGDYTVGHGGRVMLAAKLDETVQGHLEAGGSAILLAGSEDAFPADFPVKLAVREGTELAGRWFSNFNWVRGDRAPFDSVFFTRVLGFESVEVAPDYVMVDVPAENFRDVLAGVTYGWLQKNSAMALGMRVGKGRLLATTFKLDRYGRDAYATTLLDAMIRYVAGDEFAPSMQAG